MTENHRPVLVTDYTVMERLPPFGFSFLVFDQALSISARR